MNTFGERFRLMRNEKGFTQNELIDDFNKKYFYSFNKSSISLYENNNRLPEIDVLKHWAEYFNVSIDWFLGLTDVRNATVEIEALRSSKIDVSGLSDGAVNEIQD
ncbi:MAG: helix-turn-helix transcriptional regulator, partial [Clostridiaceae bacterium]|nr:helix-turn-helix transcriptional regulator [Clostridiaceae bacterium]